MALFFAGAFHKVTGTTGGRGRAERFLLIRGMHQLHTGDSQQNRRPSHDPTTLQLRAQRDAGRLEAPRESADQAAARPLHSPERAASTK